MTPLEQLIAARELISVPERWTQEVYARDADGCGTYATSSEAICWCALGALQKVCGSAMNHARAFRVLDSAVEGGGIEVFNDTRTHAEVLAVFDTAIARERSVEA